MTGKIELLQEPRPLTNGERRNVLFVDLDGTLTDPAEEIVGCFRFALEALGQTAPGAADLTWIIGPPLRRSFADLLGPSGDAEAALAVYRSRYAAQGIFEATVYDGVPEALSAFNEAGVRLILCTAKPHVYAVRILERFDLERYFAAAYGAELDGRFEDKGDLIAHILEEHGTRSGRLRDVGRSQARRRRGAPAWYSDHRRPVGLWRRGRASRGGSGGALRYAGGGPRRLRPLSSRGGAWQNAAA